MGTEWMECTNCRGTGEIAPGVKCPSCGGAGGWDVPDGSDDEDETEE